VRAARKSFTWKLILPVPVMIGALMLGAVWFIPHWVEQNAVERATASARQTIGIFRTLRAYYTESIVSRLVPSGRAKAVVDYHNVDGGIPLPATFIYDMSARLEKDDTRIRLYSAYPFPNRKDRRLDPFQEEAWRYLNSNPEGIFTRQETLGGQATLRVALPDRMVAQTCVDCHNSLADSPKKDWKIGDVRGVLEVDTAIGADLAQGRALSNTLLAILCGSGLLLALIATLMARGVSRPLLRIAEAMRKLAAGDKTTLKLEVDRKDEIGAMAEALTVFHRNALEVDHLQQEQQRLREDNEAERKVAQRSIVDQFRTRVLKVIEEVASAVERVRATAESLGATTDGLGRRAVAVAAAADQASTNVQAIAAGIEELSRSIEGIARQSGESSAAATDAVTEAQRTDGSMKSLSDTAQKIGQVVSLISEIASQTNLLALNATIEAARAGEAGKGFAVVASEVKSLANQTAKATEDITGQVRGVQEATHGAANAIDGIGRRLTAINEVTTSIAAAVEEQGAATRGIAKNAQQAAAGAADVSANIRSIHQAAEQSSTATSQFLEVTRSLADNAQRLREDTERFLMQLQAG
jgi:methyl-accepting chemotaxis protein